MAREAFRVLDRLGGVAPGTGQSVPMPGWTVRIRCLITVVMVGAYGFPSVHAVQEPGSSSLSRPG